MIKAKNKECIICLKDDQPWFSKKRCRRCATILDSKPLNREPIKKKLYRVPTSTLKNKEKRKEDRVGYKEFFEKHIHIILDEHKSCENCGGNLQGLTGEVCHILSKAKSPEVATNDDNVLYLCFYGNGCHSEFDNTLAKRRGMNIFPKAAERFKILESLLINITSETEQFREYLTEGSL